MLRNVRKIPDFTDGLVVLQSNRARWSWYDNPRHHHYPGLLLAASMRPVMFPAQQ